MTLATETPAATTPEAAAHTPPPCCLVIFGAAGDLAQRKLMPALYALACDELLPPNFAVVGTGRSEMSSNEFRAQTRQSVGAHARLRLYGEVWNHFASRLHYCKVDMDTSDGLSDLKNLLQEVDETQGTEGNRIYYFAIPPSGVPVLAERLYEQGLSESEAGSFRRVIIEKPFGRNLQTAKELNEKLHVAFSEDQVYRIDHYLGKETVQNLLVFRFANGIFEPIWNSHFIDHVQITVAEDIGIEGRAAYYEEAGALRDIIQNHAMQLIAIMGMEAPSNFQAQTIRDEKVKLLRSVRPIHPDDALSHTVRGQYDSGVVGGQSVVGYRNEKDVKSGSLRETFVAMKVDIDNWRWAGVPFYLRTGKRLPKRVTEIAVEFRRVPHSPFTGHQSIPSGGILPQSIEPNLLLLRIQPDEGITLRFSAKVPGQSMQIRSVNMDFLYGESFGRQTPDAYERLLLDCMLGDATLFAREDEVEEAWRFCSAILDGWRAHPPNSQTCPNYASGTWGPETAHELMARDGRAWREP